MNSNTKEPIMFPFPTRFLLCEKKKMFQQAVKDAAAVDYGLQSIVQILHGAPMEGSQGVFFLWRHLQLTKKNTF